MCRAGDTDTGFLSRHALSLSHGVEKKKGKKQTGYKSSLKFLFLNERRQRNKTSAETQAPLPSLTGKQTEYGRRLRRNSSPGGSCPSGRRGGLLRTERRSGEDKSEEEADKEQLRCGELNMGEAVLAICLWYL